MKIIRLLGKRGRITIPFAIRQKLKLKCGDVLSFEENNGAIIIKTERVCNNCKDYVAYNSEFLREIFERLPKDEQRKALIQLSVLWAEKEKK